MEVEETLLQIHRKTSAMMHGSTAPIVSADDRY